MVSLNGPRVCLEDERCHLLNNVRGRVLKWLRQVPHIVLDSEGMWYYACLSVILCSGNLLVGDYDPGDVIR